MKTKLIIIAISVFLLSAIYVIAQQKNVSKTGSSNVSPKRGYNYIDKNKDGICDNRQVSKNNQSGKGRNFVDKNNDGICDNRQGNNTVNCCGKGYCHEKGNGKGCQHRHGWRNGNQ